jgi:hypothetical protein
MNRCNLSTSYEDLKMGRSIEREKAANCGRTGRRARQMNGVSSCSTLLQRTSTSFPSCMASPYTVYHCLVFDSARTECRG